MWIETKEGKLLNLDHFGGIEAKESGEQWVITGYYGKPDDRNGHITLARFAIDEHEKVTEFMQVIKKSIVAARQLVTDSPE